MEELMSRIGYAWSKKRISNEESEKEFSKLLEEMEREHGIASGQYATVANEKASFYRATAQYAKGEDQFKIALDAIESVAGRGDSYAVCLASLAELYRLDGRLDECAKTLDLSQSTFVNQDTREFAACLNYRGHLHSDLGEYAKAVEQYKSALAIVEGVTNNAFERSTSYANVANALRADGDLEQAIDYYKRAKDMYDNEEAALNGHYISLLNSLALLHEQLDEDDRAHEYYREELAALEQMSISPFEEMKSLINAGRFFSRRGLTDELATLKERLAQLAGSGAMAQHPLAKRAMKESRDW